MSEIVMMVPSRSRPESLMNTWESVRDTSDVDLIAYVDSDQRQAYEHLPARFFHQYKIGAFEFREIPNGQTRFNIWVGPRVGPVSSINLMCHGIRLDTGLRRYFPEADVFGYLTDDCVIGPVGWDRFVSQAIQSFRNRIGVVSLAHSGADYVNFYALSTAMIEAIGYYAVPDTNWGWYWDTAMELIGAATDIVYADPKDVDVVHRQQITHDSLEIPAADAIRFVHWCIADRKRMMKNARMAMSARS